MKKRTLISWNVNGLRAVERKGFLDWLEDDKPDIVCLQETKAHPDQLPEHMRVVPGYQSHFCAAERKGYSGVALYTKEQPVSITCGMGEKKFDEEGRVLVADYEDFMLYNIYFPNGGSGPERLAFKMEFYEWFLHKMRGELKKGKKIVVCGDVNTAHADIDIARPKENAKTSGFLPQERQWVDRFLEIGFVDTLRVKHPDRAGQYTWWDLKSRARDRNVGWRIDYFFVSENLKRYLKEAFILQDVTGSDHCPIGIVLGG